jgi:hypothetical protein
MELNDFIIAFSREVQGYREQTISAIISGTGIEDFADYRRLQGKADGLLMVQKIVEKVLNPDVSITEGTEDGLGSLNEEDQ